MNVKDFFMEKLINDLKIRYYDVKVKKFSLTAQIYFTLNKRIINEFF